MADHPMECPSTIKIEIRPAKVDSVGVKVPTYTSTPWCSSLRSRMMRWLAVFCQQHTSTKHLSPKVPPSLTTLQEIQTNETADREKKAKEMQKLSTMKTFTLNFYPSNSLLYLSHFMSLGSLNAYNLIRDDKIYLFIDF